MIDYSIVKKKMLHRDMLHRAVLLSSIFWSVSACANINDELSSYHEQAIQQKSAIPSSTLKSLSKNSSQDQLKYKDFTDAIISHEGNRISDKQKPKNVDGAVLFVSFSMPKALLFALGDEAARFNIPLVINGLVEGDFKKTIQTFKRLNQEASIRHLNFQGVSIDPVWFTQYRISSVPALVVTQGSSSCQTQTACPDSLFDVVYGNASIKKSLELIGTKGLAAPDVAKKILERGHV
ncbi:putative conjugative transfer protein TrbC [Legionella santicrucis]|uniref:Putative conjugative transfer protein TrbC n=1 Tax=Legionella santicrucis TaxID=45074 RepID=A0A0W0ZAZ4_9GAMM|nr:type-F conjugative transfer system pilin assembly protein TrbC [Legionella santicrucis]KTD66207.1 putative conjugative transfer protein TrbC [Legionella santicrucis]